MISVLIPVYKLNFTLLVESLLEQLSSNSVPYEILIGDDSPDSMEGDLPVSWINLPVHYFHNTRSLSRSGNRNLLAQKAQYEFLLFIDGDALVDDPDYIQTYLDQLDPLKVLCGGTSYQQDPPARKQHFLRWKYGKKREVHPAAERKTQPYQSFSSFNFVVPKRLFMEIGFDEGIREYGHEDTFFGYALKAHHIPVVHLDNALIHNGLDDYNVFVEKTQRSVEGLLELSLRPDLPDGFIRENRLWKSFVKARKYGINRFLSLLFPLLKPIILCSLRSRWPGMFLFDLYKLAYLSRIQG